MGEFSGFLRDIVERVESARPQGVPLGRSWDVEGDPNGRLLAELWAFVAEGVAAYTELTASEAYLGTAADWTDLRRLAALVGYRPRPRIAAQGWVRFEVDKGVDPLVPAGTRVQAPGTPARPTQKFEVAEDTQLRSEWGGLTATWVPRAATPTDEGLRFLGDPGFRLGDRVLFLLEEPQGLLVPTDWFTFWIWLMSIWYPVTQLAFAAAQPLAVARVESRKSELGTTLVRFDRRLDKILAGTKSYGAYRIRDKAGSARRLSGALRIPATGTTADSITLPAYSLQAKSSKHVVLDAALDDLSKEQLVAIVDWSTTACDVVAIAKHTPIEWEVAPGTPTRVSRLDFTNEVATLKAATGPVTVYVVDPRIPALNYTFPGSQPSGTPQLRLFPSPKHDPTHVAVETATAQGAPVLEVFACRKAATQETPPSAGVPTPIGLVVDLLDGAPGGLERSAPASANLVRVRHGTTAHAVLGSGDGTKAGQRLTVPDEPVAYDLDDAGNPVPTQVVRVDGVRWDELPSLYDAGPAEGYVTELGPKGGVTDVFGDGVQGARLPTGRNNVQATYRVGGGTAGEVESRAIDSLLGSVKGVKKVRGAGPTSGGADQDDERRLRRLVPGRARAFGRAVSIEDLVDLSLGYPGVTHATAWSGVGPPHCPCGGAGLHLAFLRADATGVRPPVGAELASLATYLDGRRDPTIPLCVCAATATDVTLSATVVVDARLDPNAVAADAKAALLDPDGPLAPAERLLGQPLDRSDVIAVLHGVKGVLGVSSLALGGAGGVLGRHAAERYELLLVPAPTVQGVSA